MRVDFPRWEEGDLIGWISHAERYFRLHRTTNASVVEIAAIHLEGDAIQWFDWFEHIHGGLSWQQFKEGLFNHFRPIDYENIDGQLAKIQQTTTIQEYQTKFERLSNQTWLAKVKFIHQVDAFGNSPGVCRKLTEGIGSLLGWRKRVRQKKIETRQKIIGDDAVGSRQKFARRFVEGIRKLAGNTKADCRKEDRRTSCKTTGGCRSMREIWATANCYRRVNRPYPNFSDTVGFWLQF
ncbi:hypothetical protein BHE74_00054804 [Ensete ventricosum]|nr:hypothetical protein BHE74_00054804 [Ensete ventricosum]